MCVTRGTAAPPQRYEYTSSARAKKAPLVWSCCKTLRRLTDQGSTAARTASHVAQANWRPDENVGDDFDKHDNMR